MAARLPHAVAAAVVDFVTGPLFKLVHWRDSAPPAFRKAINDPPIVGGPLLLSDRHAKVRREG